MRRHADGKGTSTNRSRSEPLPLRCGRNCGAAHRLGNQRSLRKSESPLIEVLSSRKKNGMPFFSGIPFTLYAAKAFLRPAVASRQFPHNRTNKVLRIAKKHKSFVQVVERILNPRKSGAHAALDHHHGTCLVH